ncbi:MAG: exo-alpha-sialidase [Williamsia sp.]|nr:exo-alpha-sialidase [Williamsia sp.]
MNLKHLLASCLLLLLSLKSAFCQSASAAPDKISITSTPAQNPLIKGLAANPLLHLRIVVPAGHETVSFRSLQVLLNREANQHLQKLDVFFSDGEPLFATGNPIASFVPASPTGTIPLELKLSPGVHTIWLSAAIKSEAGADAKIELHCTGLKDAAGKNYPVQEQPGSFKKRIGIAVRKAGDDGVDTYRIPGLVTTDRGTLIAVYDVRYNNSKDLPANIDVGMSRSTDGGRTWEPMKIVMDMGAPHENNGVGDPSILFDPVRKKTWIAALWSKGNHSIAGSGPGLSPDESGQLVLVSSEDDGKTWSQPVNITAQVKDPAWKILFQGPGNGIAMQDGKLVFPAQYWNAAGMPYSTLIWSPDGGTTWKRGTGAKANTTESQLVEAGPGTLMLNMRDNRGSFRSIATTTNMGMDWTEHSSSYQALPDPVCMGSLIKATVGVKGKRVDVLFFSNPYSQCRRENISIQASRDGGTSWPAANQLLIDERICYGYSALTKIDDNTIGLLYEGTKDLYFVRVPVNEIVW